MTDLYSQINHFNPIQAEAITAFIDNDESGHEDVLDGLECDIGNFDTCVVGEIHNFDGYYANRNSSTYCDKCTFYANELSSRFNDADRSVFAELLVGLYEHIRQVDHKVDENEL